MSHLPLCLFTLLPLFQAVGELTAMHWTGTLRKPRRAEWTYFAVAIPYKLMLVVAIAEHLLIPTHPSSGRIVGGSLLAAVGIAIRVRGHFDLRGAFSPYVEMSPNQQITNRGLYAILRHPMYLGSLLLFLGLPLLLAGRVAWLFSLFAALGILLRIAKEEAFLSEELAGYPQYMKQTWRLIPFVY